MKKQLICIIALLSLSVSLAACGNIAGVLSGGGQNAGNQEAESAEKIPDSMGEEASGLNEQIAEAIQKAAGNIQDEMEKEAAAVNETSKEEINTPLNEPDTDVTVEPTKEPTKEPTEEPTKEPTAEPAAEPAAEASDKSAENTGNKIKVPDVEGRPVDEAESILSALGFKVMIVEKESEKAEPGFVISQSPTADKEASQGDTITIYAAKSAAKSDEKEAAKEKEESSEDGKVYLYCAASDYLTLRDIASRSGKELDRIPYNAKLEFLGMEGEFTFVSYNGQNGYVLTEFLSSVPDPAKNYSSGKKVDGNDSRSLNTTLYCCASEYATLRSSASRSASEVAKIYSREAVNFISSVGEWFYVDYNGLTGYVLQSYFSFDPNAPLNYGDR